MTFSNRVGGADHFRAGARPRRAGRESPPMPGMVWVPGGTFRMGSNDGFPEEAPVHAVDVAGFWMDEHPVTNLRFARFIESAGYKTSAELAPGSLVFTKPSGPVSLEDPHAWWDYVSGTDWKHPAGPGSSIKGIERHPVVHVTHADAHAFASWEGKQLPTEAEWEFAARGGLEGATYAWGNRLMLAGRPMANYWQGDFPHHNSRADGWEGTSPVGYYPPNGYGLYDMIGNVWEWTSDTYRAGHVGDEEFQEGHRVVKGGSHLCSANYCRRYRPAARRPEPIDAASSHVGFRCIVRPSP